MLLIRKGNIFNTKCQTIVNTVNCNGVMGAGIALEFKLRFPDMYNKYKLLCKNNALNIGQLWIYNTQSNSSSLKKVLNFPTKKSWKLPSKIEYLSLGLDKFVSTYNEKGITSIAFPILGASRGKLDENIVLELMEKRLKQCDIDIEIWYFDPTAKDDLYEDFAATFNQYDTETLKQETGLRIDKIEKIKSALALKNINSLSALSSVKGIGLSSLEKSFQFTRKKPFIPNKNLPLF